MHATSPLPSKVGFLIAASNFVMDYNLPGYRHDCLEGFGFITDERVKPVSNLEREFYNALVDIYRRAKKECRYNASLFLDMVINDNNSVLTARKLLSSDQPQYGFTRLYELNRLDLTVEAHVLKDHFYDLFNDEDRKCAADRLSQYDPDFLNKHQGDYRKWLKYTSTSKGQGPRGLEGPHQPCGTGDESIDNLRNAIEHRAAWFYLLMDEARKKGIDWEEIARPAIFRCGCIHGEAIKAKCDNPKNLEDFQKAFITEPAKRVFEMEIVKSTENELEIHFHYCPLVSSWQQLGCSTEDLGLLCDISMDGDRGIVSVFDSFTFELGDTIAQGHPTCELRFVKQGT